MDTCDKHHTQHKWMEFDWEGKLRPRQDCVLIVTDGVDNLSLIVTSG